MDLWGDGLGGRRERMAGGARCRRQVVYLDRLRRGIGAASGVAEDRDAA
jgi:hypothetical protein